MATPAYCCCASKNRSADAAAQCVHASRESKKKRGQDNDASTEESIANAKATAAIQRRKQEGHQGESDKAAETGTPNDHKEQQVHALVEKHHLDRDDARQRVDETIRSGSLVRWIQSAQQSPAFFDVEPLPNVVQVAFNTNHPVHSHLWAVMHPELADDATPDEVRERLEKAAMAFRVLIYSWARFEEEQTERDRRTVRNARYEWGKIRRGVLRRRRPDSSPNGSGLGFGDDGP